MIAEGTQLGRYRVRSRLGAGGMGEVYLADDTQLHRQVALKLLPPHTAADAQARTRLMREARAAASLDHPYICSVYEVGEADGLLFIAMQYVEGQTLDARLRAGAVDLPTTLAIAVQVVDALADAHKHGILHRDIKPSNIMLTPRGEAKVMDFGLARVTAGEGPGRGNTETGPVASAPGAIMGTALYMSPEQVRGGALDARSDLFSAGIVLYEMVTGRRPFDDPSSAVILSAILTQDPLPLARFAPDTPTELERIVTKALRKDPNDRYQTAQDLLIDLRTLRDDLAFQRRLDKSASSHGAVSSPAPRSNAADIPAPTVITPPTVPVRTRSPLVWGIAAAAIVVAAAGGWFAWKSTNVRWATGQLPQITALADARRYFDAYDLAVAVEPYLPADPALTALMPMISDTLSAITDPPGAQVYLTRFNPDASGALPARVLAGTTPFTNLRIARGEYILAIEKEGYAPNERTISGIAARLGAVTIVAPSARVEQRLIAADAMPPRMVFVPGSDYRLVGWSRPTDRRIPLSDYFIDKYEVSNAEFKEFINAGGYLKREYWQHPFIGDGREIAADEAMKTFVDRTGLPGPRDWSNQMVPEGRADHPVTDVTWYEAAAYAAFRGKRLPSVHQWEKAARNGVTGLAGTAIMPWGIFYPGDALAHRANFGGSSALAVTSGEFGMSAFGAYNMAGNVAEWTTNDSTDGFLATGGAWGDPTYTFAQYGGRPGMFSSNKLGFRLARYASAVADDSGMRIETTVEIPEYTRSSDATFKTLAARYRYEQTPLDARIEETKETPEWKIEKITYNGADGERAIAYLYLPNHVARPLQVLTYLPAGDVDAGFQPLANSLEGRMGPFVKAGRAVFGVVLKGYIGRLLPAGQAPPDPTTVEYVEKLVNRVTDIRRGLDYLATRTDVDIARMAFVAPSAGSQIGLILGAVEPRYRGVIMMGAGIPRSRTTWAAAANPINFTPHIRVPKLIVQGRYDEDSPLKTSMEPMYKLMVEPKQMFLYDGGHVPSNEVMMAGTAAWLDATLGPVRR